MRTSQRALGEKLRSWAERLEIRGELDSGVERLEKLAGLLRERPDLKRFLQGDWLGHSLHPLMTDFPLGAWMSASLLDLFGGAETRKASEGLIAFGVALSIPTALAGMSDWTDTNQRTKRVGVVHASMNAGITLLYVLSFGARRRGHHQLGVVLGLTGGTISFVSGYLGGHLSLVRGAGVDPNDLAEVVPRTS